MPKLMLPTAALALLAGAASAQVMIDGNVGNRAEQGMPTTQEELNAKATSDAILTDSDSSAIASTANSNIVNVTLPTGTVQIDTSDGQPWYKSDKLGGYKNYYFDAATNSYVVYDTPKWESRLKDRWDESGAATGKFIPEKAAVTVKAKAKKAPITEVKTETTETEEVIESTTTVSTTVEATSPTAQ